MCPKFVKVVNLILIQNSLKRFLELSKTMCLFTRKSKNVDEKESVYMKIEETRQNVFHVRASESDYSEVETETSKS